MKDNDKILAVIGFGLLAFLLLLGSAVVSIWILAKLQAPLWVWIIYVVSTVVGLVTQTVAKLLE